MHFLLKQKATAFCMRDFDGHKYPAAEGFDCIAGQKDTVGLS
jgi:hypothetical protein